MRQKLKGLLPINLTDDQVAAMTRIFKVLADPSRLRIISELTKGEEMSVSEIAKAVDMTSSAVSHHLSILEHLDFASNHREGKRVLYYLSDKCIYDILRRAKAHVS